MERITIEEAGQSLAQVLKRHDWREPVVITEGSEPIALVVPYPDSTGDAPAEDNRPAAGPAGTPAYGGCKGMISIVGEDDEHLKDFEDYM